MSLEDHEKRHLRCLRDLRRQKACSVHVCNFAHSSLVYQDHHLTQQEKHILGLERKFYKVHMGN